MLIGRYACVLDACVLHPAFLCANLLWFAQERLFQPVWTETIWNEWQRSLSKRFGDPPEKLVSKREAITKAFPEAMAATPQSLVDSLKLPDADDRHVLAAAIVAKADGLITTNLKHFPPETCSLYDVEVVHPDTFLVNVIDLDETRALEALQKHRSVLRNPPFTAEEFVAKFERVGLVQTHQRLGPLTSLLG